MPSAMDDISRRLKLKLPMAVLKAWFSAPISAVLGTCTSCSTIWQSSRPCMPSSSSFLPRLTPAWCASTMKQLIDLWPASLPVRAKHHDAVGHAAERDPGLGAVEYPAVFHGARGGGDAGHVGAEVGLGHGGGHDDGAVEDAGDQRLLALVAVVVQEQRRLHGNRERVADGARAARQLFHHEAGADGVEARAAGHFGQAHAEQAELGHAAVQHAVELVFAVDGRGARQHFALGETTRGVAQRDLVFGEEMGHGLQAV